MSRLSPHLHININTRLSCSCGCGFGGRVDHWDKELIWGLERLIFDAESKLGKVLSLNIHSGGRCPTHNATIRGAHPQSRHQGRPPGFIPCQAIDFHIEDSQGDRISDAFVATILDRFWLGGIGFYPWGIHIDVGRKSRWPRQWWTKERFE